MAWVLVHEEDWSSYGTDIDAVSNNVGPDYGRYVYPDLIGSNLSGHGTTVGPTSGPDGGPGISDLATSHGQVYEHPLAINCRGAKITIRKDLTGWTPSPSANFGGTFAEGWWTRPSAVPGEPDVSDILWDVLIFYQSSGNHSLIVAAEGGALGSDDNYNSGHQLLIPRSGAFTIEIEVWRSTITGSPGAWVAAEDGQIIVRLDGTPIWDTGLIKVAYNPSDVFTWNGDPLDYNPPELTGGGPYWNLTTCGLFGRTGAWRVYASDECATTSDRNLLTGQGHTVTGSDNLIVGVLGTLIGDRVVLFALDGGAHRVTGNGKLVIHGDVEIHGGVLFSSTTAGGGYFTGYAPGAGAVALAGLAPTLTVA